MDSTRKEAPAAKASAFGRWPKAPLLLVGLAGGALLLLGLGGPSVVDGPTVQSLSFGDLALRLGLVLVVAYVSILGVKYYVGRAGGRCAATPGIRVVERCRLGPQQTLFLITVADRALLLGATPTNLATLAELGEAESVLAPGDGKAAAPFGQQLRALGVTIPSTSQPAAASVFGKAVDDAK